MTTISAGSVVLDAFNNFYNIMTDQITDTNATVRVGSDFIKSAWPNRHNHPESKWVDYPIMTIKIEEGDFVRMGLNNNFPKGELKVKYAIYDKSRKNLDTMANQVTYVLKKNKSNLEGSGYHNLTLNSSTSPFTDSSNAQLHHKTIISTYEYRENFTQA